MTQVDQVKFSHQEHSSVVRERTDKTFLQAITPVVEDAIHSSVAKNPTPLADALFPVMGPAIRKAISDALRKMILSINQTLEHSFSLKAVKWRMQALITGKPYAEIVLLQNLAYQIRHLFLIHRETGLLLQHVSMFEDDSEKDSDMVSGMMKAVQDFVQDSFQLEQTDQLGTIQVGDLNLWVESGPQALLVAVVTGVPPPRIRDEMIVTLERIHGKYARELTSFQGDAGVFAPVEEELLHCCEREGITGKKKKRSFAGLILLALAFLVSGYFIVRAADRNIRWNRFMTELKALPGIIVTDHWKKGQSRFVEGLRDPLSQDPAPLLERHRIHPDRVTFRWERYLAQHEPFVQQRTIELLDPPPTVSLRISNDTLYASGKASAQWIGNARERLKGFWSVGFFNTDHLINENWVLMLGLVDRIEAEQLLFPVGQTQLPVEQIRQADRLTGMVRDLLNQTSALGQSIIVVIQGMADSTGDFPGNRRISQQRAQHVADRMIRAGLPEEVFVVKGIEKEEDVIDAKRTVTVKIERKEEK